MFSQYFDQIIRLNWELWKLIRLNKGLLFILRISLELEIKNKIQNLLKSGQKKDTANINH